MKIMLLLAYCAITLSILIGLFGDYKNAICSMMFGLVFISIYRFSERYKQ